MSMSIFHSVYLDANLCVGCTTCVRHCPTRAIRVRQGKAHIMEERCIDCGECIRICPKGAKKSATDPVSLLSDYEIRVALPAPSIYGQFGSNCRPAQVFDALHNIGFDEVVDVAWGASVLTPAIRRYVERTEMRPLISSACPVVVRLIQLRFPSLLPNLVPFLQPMEIAARQARDLLAQVYQADLRYSVPERPGQFDQGKVGVFFITPCTSKVTAIRLPLGYKTSMISAVFSFQDIFPSLEKAISSQHKRAESGPTHPKWKFSQYPGLGTGIDWARSDGELESLRIPGAVSVDGIENVIALFEDIDNGKFTDIPYIEALACPGGCVGGPMAVANPHVARSTIKAVAAQARISVSSSERQNELGLSGDSASLDTLKTSASQSASSQGASSQGASMSKGFVGPSLGSVAPSDLEMRWETEILPTPVMMLDQDFSKALRMAEDMERIVAVLPGLDCGACGGPDCRSLAEDIVKGKAKLDDCIVRMRRKNLKISKDSAGNEI